MNNILLAAFSGTGFLAPLYWVFGKCMAFLMELIGNQYFIAIIIFTFVTRLLLLPLNIRQQKTMAKTTRLQPKIKKIQDKYRYTGNDPRERQKNQQKMNEEMQNLYAREGHNPMQMGCGPMLFQMLFLMGIIGIIYYPISYVLGASAFSDNSEAIMKTILPIYQGIVGDDTAKIQNIQLNILEHFDSYKTALQSGFAGIFTDSMCEKIKLYRDGMSLFSLDMTAIPHWKNESGGFNTLVIIPILSLVTSLGSSVVSTIIQKKNNPAMQQQGQMMLMMLMMPFFSFYIAFRVPAAVGFYWIISNIVAILQQIFIFKQYPPRKAQAKIMVENTIERRSREENIKKTK